MNKFSYTLLSICLGLSLGACSSSAGSHNGKDPHDHEKHAEEAESHHHDEEHNHGGHYHENDNSEEDESMHEHEGAITMTPEQIASFGIKTTPVNPGEFIETIKVSGQIEEAPTDIVTLSAKRDGIISFREGLTVGSDIAAGTTICNISTDGLQGGDVNAVYAANLEKAKKELERVSSLHKESIVTDSEFNEAERAYKEALALVGLKPGLNGTSSLSSPVSGIITGIFATSGQYVETGTPVASVIKSSRLTLRADVPERFAPALAYVESANFRPDYSKETFSLENLRGTKSSSGTGISKNGFIPVYFTFDNNGKTIPGTYAEIFLKGKLRTNVLTVPRSSLIEMQGNKYVYVCKHGHAFEKRLVKTGASDGINTEILSGIENGEEIVTEGAAIVRMAETSAVAPPGHSHNH